MILEFPKDFYWGSSTSAHQVEGNNHNDWTEWEQKNCHRLAREAKDYWQSWQVKKFPEMLEPENYLSGWACDHYNRFEEDFDIAQSLHQNAHRFSIEWSRIEPENGKFNEKEIEHYRKVIKALKERNIEPFVTLWHWTNPVWISDSGGWENKNTVVYFARYVEKIVEELGQDIRFWITLNEPTVYLSKSFIVKVWPPQKRKLWAFFKAYKNLARAHNQAYQIIHKTNKSCSVGLANNISFVEPKHRYCLADQLMSRGYRYFGGERMFNMTKNHCDFLSVQYYFHDVLCIYNVLRYFSGINHSQNEKKAKRTDLGWDIYPEGIYHVLSNLKKYDKPIYITENGLADAGDRKRKKFIEDHLFWLHKAIEEGVDVRGYFYWSLLDNFEWDKGFWPRFGLVAVGRKTMKRKIRKSAFEYAKICEASQLEI
jgi:beta-glucosidase